MRHGLALPNLPIYWNWNPNNIHDQKQCVQFRKSQKVLKSLHPTLIKTTSCRLWYLNHSTLYSTQTPCCRLWCLNHSTLYSTQTPCCRLWCINHSTLYSTQTPCCRLWCLNHSALLNTNHLLQVVVLNSLHPILNSHKPPVAGCGAGGQKSQVRPSHQNHLLHHGGIPITTRAGQTTI